MKVMYKFRMEYTSLTVYIVMLFFFLMMGVGSVSASAVSGDNAKLINVSFKNKQLRDIIAEVAKQTGYKIEISEGLLSQKATGRYENIDMDAFLRRVFKGRNVFQIIDDKTKVVKIYSSLREKGKTVTVDSNVGFEYGDQPLDGQPDKTLSALLRERDMFFENVDTSAIPLDESSGVTPGELKRRQEQFYKNVNAGAIPLDPDSGASPEGLKQKQQEFYKTVDVENIPLGDETTMTPRSLRESRDKFYESVVDVGDIPLDETTQATPNSLRKGAQAHIKK